MSNGFRKIKVLRMGKKTYTPTIANGPANDAPSIALGSNLQGENLSWVEPRNSKPSSTKYRSIKEYEKCCGAANMALATFALGIDRSSSEATCDKHAYALSNCSPV